MRVTISLEELEALALTVYEGNELYAEVLAGETPSLFSESKGYQNSVADAFVKSLDVIRKLKTSRAVEQEKQKYGKDGCV